MIQADGGTRTAAITGGYVALYLAFEHLRRESLIERVPLSDQVAAISCGIYKDTLVADLDYAEDSNAQADANFVLTATGGIVEIQATAEERPFEAEQFAGLLEMARAATTELFALQRAALDID